MFALPLGADCEKIVMHWLHPHRTLYSLLNGQALTKDTSPMMIILSETLNQNHIVAFALDQDGAGRKVQVLD